MEVTGAPAREQVVGEGVAQAVGGQVDLGLLAVAHQALVDGGGGQAVELVAEEDEVACRAGGRSAR